MVSEIQKELEENVAKMRELMQNQKFTTGDAEKFLARYFNIARKMEDLETSRDLWRDKYNVIEKCKNCEICIEHSKGRKKK